MKRKKRKKFINCYRSKQSNYCLLWLDNNEALIDCKFIDKLIKKTKKIIKFKALPLCLRKYRAIKSRMESTKVNDEINGGVER